MTGLVDRLFHFNEAWPFLPFFWGLIQDFVQGPRFMKAQCGGGVKMIFGDALIC